jgi:predicted lipid-binding transport protein (Tim44 family)
MFDVMIYAALATVVCVMMYSILGKQTGFGSGPDQKLDPQAFGMEGPANDTEEGPDAIEREKDLQEAERLGLSAITRLDPSFSIAQFMDGANQAYSMILDAYAGGDRALLGELLTDETYAVYDAAITAREAAGQTQVTDLGRLRKTSISGARTEGSIGFIRVLYEAELTSALLDAEGKLVQGDPDVLSAVSEIWEYTRDLRGDDPNWRLAEVEPSEGDALDADPTPDTKPA